MNKLISKIREATTQLHEETENLIFANTDNITRQDYINFLQINCTFYQVLEPAIADAGFTQITEWKEFDRSRLKNLKHDLENISAKVCEHPLDSPFDNWSEAGLLGAAYVSEGSSLGGQVLLKKLSKQPFFDVEKNGTFLKGNGHKTGHAWKAFLELIEREGRNSPDEVVKGAENSFKLFLQIAKTQKTSA